MRSRAEATTSGPRRGVTASFRKDVGPVPSKLSEGSFVGQSLDELDSGCFRVRSATGCLQRPFLHYQPHVTFQPEGESARVSVRTLIMGLGEF